MTIQNKDAVVVHSHPDIAHVVGSKGENAVMKILPCASGVGVASGVTSGVVCGVVVAAASCVGCGVAGVSVGVGVVDTVFVVERKIS